MPAKSVAEPLPSMEHTLSNDQNCAFQNDCFLPKPWSKPGTSDNTSLWPPRPKSMIVVVQEWCNVDSQVAMNDCGSPQSLEGLYFISKGVVVGFGPANMHKY